MPRSGHVDRLFHGANLAIQVGYRLGGVQPEKSLSQEAIEIQVDYRLGDTRTDSRAVWFLGDGATAELLAYRPGDRVGPTDGVIVRDAMFGIDRRTGQRINARVRRNPHARIVAAPVWSVIAEACTAAGIDPLTVHGGRDLAAQMGALAKAGMRPRGTVAFATARDLLRSNEHAWTTYDKAIAAGRAADPPAFRIDRAEAMRRLGAYQRTAQTDLTDGPTSGPVFDLSLDDEALGTAVWDAVERDSQLRIESGVAGFEMTLTCPKSLSVAALLAPEDTREQWLELVRDASRDAIDELMRRVGHGRSGHEGHGQSAPAIRGLGYAATVSVEAHSRHLDPHLHGHVMIPNRVLCVDGKERAIATGGTDLINHAWWLQAQFERRLRAMSVDRGLVASWEMDHRTQQWEVTGADPDIMAFFSQGHAAVHAEKLAQAAGQPLGMSRRALQLIDNRAKKHVTGRKGDQVLTWGQIRDRMHTRADAAGIDLTAAFAMEPFDPADQPDQWDDDLWARTIEDVVCEHKPAEISARIEAAVRCYTPHNWDDDRLADLARTVKRRAFTVGVTRARGRVGTLQWASNSVAAAEERAFTAYANGVDANTHRLTHQQAAAGLARYRADAGWDASGRAFTAGQEALFWQMTTGTDRVSTVVGAAGSGKTTAIDAARVALGSAGQNVFGICVAAIAAQAMRDTARVQAGTVTWLTTRIDFARNPHHPARAAADRLGRSRYPRERRQAEAIRRRYAIPNLDHLVIDEASMIGAKDLATVLDWTAEHDITVTLIGDTQQLQSVDASGPFSRLHAARPGAELTENLRQQTDTGRECAAFLRDGNAEEALLLLADAGQLVVATSQTHAQQILIDAWAERAAQAATVRERILGTGLESDRNDQVDILNTLARHEARQRGWITGPDRNYTASGRTVAYAEGDHILITANVHRRNRASFANGTRALVTATTEAGLNITYWDESGEHTDHLTARQAVTHARHGYAMTTHKLQGQTVDSLVIDFGPERDLSSAYVALTRHRNDVLTVVNIADIAEGAELEHLLTAGPEIRRDAVIAKVAAAIEARGFDTSPLAHDITAIPLPPIPSAIGPILVGP
jgi:conjugative relaxase-like TrwC/TraI family protein